MSISEEGFLNDLKEVYLAWNFSGSHYMDMGRVNVKNGVALGFNPTGYFKKDAVTVRVSQDTSILRENRLGALMFRAQGIWEKGTFTLAVAPEVPHGRGEWWTDSYGGGLQLQRTNDRTRVHAKFDMNVFPDLKPELLYFYDDGRSNVGLNLTRGVGANIIAYAEWNLGQRRGIMGDSLEDARKAGAIPFEAPNVIPTDMGIRFQNQLAVGFSYSEKINRTTNIEYHYNEAGFSSQNWDDWFSAGATAARLLQIPAMAGTGQSVLGQLWAIRQFAQEAQEPLSQHALFIRSFWQDALINRLDLTGIFQINHPGW